MRELLLATSNPGKISEFNLLVSGSIRVVSPADKGDIPPPQVDEKGHTYFENSLSKALRYFEAYGVPVVADDSGLECDGIEGMPGVHTALFAKGLPWSKRWERLIHELVGKSRSARFRAVLCYYDGVDVPRFFQGTVEGEIIERPRGEKGFGFDPVFLIPSIGKTLAEVESEVKNKISHRAEACRALLTTLRSLDLVRGGG